LYLSSGDFLHKMKFSSKALFVIVATAAILSSYSVSAQNNGTYSTCLGFLTSASGQYTYRIDSLNNKIFNASSYVLNYTISMCTSLIPNCGLCSWSGFCEHEEWYDNCVGQFSSITALDDGTGLSLFYPDGEFGRSGTVALVCSTEVWNATVSNDGNNATVYTNVACPVNPPGDTCSDFGSSCSSCLANAQRRCSFCLDTMTCVEDNTSCQDYWRNPNFCAKLDPCMQLSTCQECTEHNSDDGCFWCPGSDATCMRSTGTCDNGRISHPQYCDV